MAEAAIATAEKLCAWHGGRGPTKMDLRRGVSTAYYAVFNKLSETCANSTHGTDKSKRSEKAWSEMRRGLSHGVVREACLNAASVEFPPEIQRFAQAFVQLHDARVAADYNPMVEVDETEVLGYIELAKTVNHDLDAVTEKDKKAFATWVMISTKGAKDSRRRAREGRETNM